MEKVLGFWSKLFTSCVSLKDYLLMKKSQEEAVKDLENKIINLNKMKADKDELETKVTDLTVECENLNQRLETASNKISSLENIVSEQKTKVGTLTTSLSNEKERHEFTLKMLKEVQDKESGDTAEVNIANTEPELETVSGDFPIGDAEGVKVVAMEVAKEVALVEDDIQYSADIPTSNVAIDNLSEESPEVVVAPTNKLYSFMETLTPSEVSSLHKAILEAHKNDKRLNTTMLNWISKSPDEFTQATNMFGTALNRMRGKAILSVWYDRYANFEAK